jgi:hypothetical protein
VIESTVADDVSLAEPLFPDWVPAEELVLSPELVLVDPELRGRAIVQLPEQRPYAFLDDLRHAPLRTFAVAPSGAAPAREGGFAVAAGAYLLTALVRTCALDLAVFVGVAILVLVASVFS